MVLAVLAFLVCAAFVVALLTGTFALDDRTEAWVGAALTAIGALLLVGWAAVIHVDEPLEWAERAGGDLLLAALGVGFVVAGAATFAGGVL